MSFTEAIGSISATQKHACAVCSANAKHSFALRGFDYYQCGHCGTLSTFPVPSSAQITKYYEEKFLRGNYLTARELTDYDRTCQQLATLLSKYYGPELKGRAVMDIGCFTGGLLFELQKEYACEVMGVELQKEAVAIAKNRLNGKVLQMDVNNSDFPNKQYDVITLTGVIEHVVYPTKLLKRVSELIKQNGVIMLQTPNAESMVAKLMGTYWPPLAPIEHIHIHSKRSIEMILTQLGFVDIEVKRHWKFLTMEYVFSMMQTFGPELRKILSPFFKILPKNMKLPLYAGEIVVFARKK